MSRRFCVFFTNGGYYRNMNVSHAHNSYGSGKLIVYSTDINDLMSGIYKYMFVNPYIIPSEDMNKIKRENKIVLTVESEVDFDSTIEMSSSDGKVYPVGDERLGTRRHVYPAEVHGRNTSVRFGLTVHKTLGSWSSWPPHKFEANSLLSPISQENPTMFQETFVFFTEPKNSWGIQVLSSGYTDKPETNILFDRSIHEFELCSHPVVAAPETRLAYFWFYVGGEEKFNEHGRV